jgi:hypothetical protein
MLEQVSEAGAPDRLVLGADIVPDADRDDRRLAVLVDDDAKAVVEGEGVVGNVDLLDELGQRIVRSARLGLDRRDALGRASRQREAGKGEHDQKLTHARFSPFGCGRQSSGQALAGNRPEREFARTNKPLCCTIATLHAAGTDGIRTAP